MGNTLNCSTFLKKESGLRASPEAVEKFKAELEKHGKEIIVKLQEEVERKKKKTIQTDDFVD